MRPFALTSVLMMLACSEATGPDGRFTTNLGPGEFAIATADTDVTLHFVGGVLSGNIPFEFTNVSNQTIYLPNCNGGYELALERPYRGGWMYAWSGFLPGCISPAIRLAPGETRQDTMGIYAYTSMIVRPPSAEDPIEGLYRITITYAYRDYDEEARKGDLLPKRLRASNEFTVRVE